MTRRARIGRPAGLRAASYGFVVNLPMQPAERVAEIDAEARRISGGRCGRWTAPDKLHIGFVEAAHRDAFVLWLTLSGIAFA